MAQRGVTETDVEWALKRETRQSPGEPGTIWHWGTASGGRTLKVLMPAADDSLVITVAWPDA